MGIGQPMFLRRLSLCVCACIATAMLASCGPSPNAPGPGGVTKAQAAELNEAAATLDQRTRDAESEHGAH